MFGAALTSVAISTVSANQVTNDIIHHPITLNNVAQNQKLYLEYQNRLAWELAPIKTEVELQEELNNPLSPLHLLSEYGKQQFIESIVFREDGLGGMSMQDLEAELTPTQIYAILSLFGAQRIISKFDGARIESTADLMLLSPPKLFSTSSNKLWDGENARDGRQETGPDHKDYACVSRATCAEQQGSICMSSC